MVRLVRILHVVDNLDIGGTETQMVQMAQHLDPNLYQVNVATLRGGGPLTKNLECAGIRVIEFPKGHTMLSLQAICQLIRMAWFIRAEKIDVVHAHDLWSNLLAIPAAWLARAPLIISSQRNLATISWYTPYKRRIARCIHLMAKTVVANSDAVKRVLVNDLRVPANRVVVLHNGVDLRRFTDIQAKREQIFPQLNRNTKVVVNVANMNTEIKGHAVLLEAAREVLECYADVMFVFIGDGVLRPHLEQKASALGLEKHTLFLGRRLDVPAILLCADVFAFSSFAEGFPNSVLEAAAAGLPIVATTVGGIPEIVENGVNGVLTNPRDAHALAQGILSLLSTPELAAKFSVASRDRVRSTFSLDRAVAQLVELYSAR